MNTTQTPSLIIDPAENTMESGRVMTAWLRHYTGAALREGIRIEQLLQESGLHADELEGRVSHITRQQYHHFILALIRLCPREDFALQISNFFVPESFHFIHAVVHDCRSLAEVLERFIFAQNLILNGSQARLFDLDNGNRVLEFTPLDYQPAAKHFLIDAYFSGIVQFGRLLLNNPDCNPAAVSLSRPHPANTLAFHRVFQCPITFGANHPSITIDVETLMQPLGKF